MKVISYNVNGIRAALSKGFMDWFETEMPDVIHIQETKALQEQVDVDMLRMYGYQIHWFAAEQRGYSGVATFTKIRPKQVIQALEKNFLI
jgi:exodeoxyribonuclease-3